MEDVRRFNRGYFERLRGSAATVKDVPELLESIAVLFSQGYALEDVALMFGVSRERVRQWANRHGIIRPFSWTPQRAWSDEHNCFMPGVSVRTVQQQRRAEAYEQKKADSRDNAQERFWGQVSIGSDNECWPWQGRLVDINKRGRPYGITYLYGKTGGVLAHRAAFLYTYGWLPYRVVGKDGQMICHSCNNSVCVNPQHLYVGTMQDNINDAMKCGTHIASPARRQELRAMSRIRVRVFCQRGHRLPPYLPPEERPENWYRYCRVCNRIATRASYSRRKKQA